MKTMQKLIGYPPEKSWFRSKFVIDFLKASKAPKGKIYDFFFFFRGPITPLTRSHDQAIPTF